MEYEKMVDVEVVVENGKYASVVSLDIANFMLKANIVTVRNTSVEVREIEVTDKGVIRFHGNPAKL